MNKYMIVFTLIVIGSYLISYAARNTPIQRLNAFHRPIPNPFGFVIPAAAFTIFSGLRNTLGDTETYIYSYRLMDMDTMEPVRFTLSGGTFYNFLQYRIHLIDDDPYKLIMITAIFAVVPVVYILYKYAWPYELAIAMFVLTSYYTFSMNGIRQYAAAGMLLLGTKYLFSEKKIDFLKFMIFIFLAWLWHTSAIFMIPLYFIARRRAWTPFTTLLLGGTVLLTLVFDNILPAFLDALEDTDYSIYAENGWFTTGISSGSNIIRVAVLIVPLVGAYMLRDRMYAIHGRRWEILVNLSIVNLAFYIVSLYNWIFARFAVYTSVYAIIMMTYLIQDGFSDRGESNSVYPLSLALYSFYFYNVSYSVTGYGSVFF